ncbi:unnamed protein product, partial [Mesorhabditis spiculigera]
MATSNLEELTIGALMCCRLLGRAGTIQEVRTIVTVLDPSRAAEEIDAMYRQWAHASFQVHRNTLADILANHLFENYGGSTEGSSQPSSTHVTPVLNIYEGLTQRHDPAAHQLLQLAAVDEEMLALRCLILLYRRTNEPETVNCEGFIDICSTIHNGVPVRRIQRQFVWAHSMTEFELLSAMIEIWSQYPNQPDPPQPLN